MGCRIQRATGFSWWGWVQFPRWFAALWLCLPLAGCFVNQTETIQVYDVHGQIDPAVGGVDLTLTDANGGNEQYARTDRKGRFQFSRLAVGQYIITPAMEGYEFNPSSFAFPVSNQDISVNFKSVRLNPDLLSGRYQIYGRVSNSANGGVAEVKVELSGDATTVAVTDSDGNFNIPDLANGNYVVTVSLAGYQFQPVSQDVTINNQDAAVNFSASPVSGGADTYAISGQVRNGGGTAMAGVTLSLSGAASASTSSDAQGNYQFTGLAAGNYTLNASASGYKFQPAPLAVALPTASGGATGQDFTGLPFYTLQGHVLTAGGAGVNGITVNLSGAGSDSRLTNATGIYTFNDLTDGSYTLTPSSAAYTFSPPNFKVDIKGATPPMVDFTATPVPVNSYHITGRVLDNTGKGLGSVNVSLSGAATTGTTTDANGNYVFSALANGSYNVAVTLPGYSVSPTQQSVAVSGADRTGIDFTATPLIYKISGHIALGATGLAQVTLTLNGTSAATTTSDANGDYVFTGLRNGSYTVAPSLATYIFAPASASVTVNSKDVANINFTATAQTYSLSGAVTFNSSGLAGVQVTAGGSSTTTNNAGGYILSGLSSGIYTVTPTLANYIFTPTSQNIDLTNGNASNVNFSAVLVTHVVSGRVVAAGGAALAGVSLSINGSTLLSDNNGNYRIALANGGYTLTASLSGYTFNPASQPINVNGADVSVPDIVATPVTAATYSITVHVVDAAQAALSGVSLALGDAATASGSTDAGGNYTFSGLANGSYTVTPTKSGYSFTPASLSLTINGANGAANFTASQISSGGITLYITEGSIVVNNDAGAPQATLPAWGFSQSAGGVAAFPPPVLIATVGDKVSITVVNNHSVSHNFVIPGLSADTTAIPPLSNQPNNQHTYNFVATSAGTYLYQDTLNSEINREMGLYGAFVVKAAGAASYPVERTWVLGDMDIARWNDLANANPANSGIDTAVYKPNYFLINGRGGFDGMKAADTTIAGAVGDNALLHVVNGGLFSQVLHFHSNHVDLLYANGVQYSAPYRSLDVVTVPPKGRVELLFNLNQCGKYPMHNHAAQMETANGVYLNGVATMIDAVNKQTGTCP